MEPRLDNRLYMIGISFFNFWGIWEMTLKLALFMYDVSMYLNRKITINEDLIEILIIFFEYIYDSVQEIVTRLLEIDKKEDISQALRIIMLEYDEEFLEYLNSLVFDSRNMIKLLDDIPEEDISLIGDLVVLFKQYLDNIVDMNMVRIRH